MLAAICREAEILTEERQHMILESIGDCAGVRAGVDLKAVCDSIVIEDIVQLGRRRRAGCPGRLRP